MPTSHTLTPSTPPRRRILFLDAHDSFSNNITSLLHTLLDADVFVLPIDAPLVDAGALRDELARYDAVVCGPGPGSPDRDADVGLMRHVWEEAAMPIPALGICLGFQSLAVSCGAQIRRLRRGLHGMVRTIAHRAGEEEEEEEEGNVFAGVGVFRATLYHSLGVDVGQDTFCGTQAEWEARARWRRPEPCPDVVPLAWVDEPRGGADDDVGDGDGDGFGAGGVERILMAMRHRTRPFWGVQYHPESVCTEAEGNKVVVNWFREALRACRVVAGGSN
ncbi:hypothetical protein P8C59_006104 [Phyllachora maydis]|uniref:anthranilate synthase n=1 Tax=Phyllachora maydis TaxID=1825666 RepID=A0AAD9ME80_9PEZI|nr:hypothetical protein P8C59_006104 [Phyllachora maydis]